MSLKIYYKILYYTFVALMAFTGVSQAHEPTAQQRYNDFKNTTFSEEAGKGERHPEIELTDNSSLSDYLAYAAHHNPELEAAFNRWKASLEMIPQVTSLPDPQLTYEYDILRVDPQRHKIDIEQMFPWYGTRDLRGKVAWKESQELREKYEALKTNLFYKVKLAYFEYYYLSRTIDITQKNLELMTALEQSARIKYASGKASYADVINAQVEIAKFEEQLVGLIDLKNPRIAEFNALLNRAVDGQFPIPASIPSYVLTLSDETLQTLMKEVNPELREFDIQIKRETDRILLAKKQFYPDLMVGLSYTRIDEAQMPGAKDPFMTMFSVNVPVWRDRYRAALREAEITRKSAESSKTSRENDLAAELSRAFYNYRDSERKIDLYKNVLIPKAQESLDISSLAYITGTDDFLNLLHAQSTLLDLEMMYEQMLTESAQSFSQIEMLVGKELTDENKQ